MVSINTSAALGDVSPVSGQRLTLFGKSRAERKRSANAWRTSRRRHRKRWRGALKGEDSSGRTAALALNDLHSKSYVEDFD